MLIAFKKNDKIFDLHTKDINENNINYEQIERNSEDGENILRHSAAHVLGEILQNKYKNIEFAVGPVTEYGFYYDVLMTETISSHDLIQLTNLMKESIRKKQLFTKQNISKQEACKHFSYDKCKKLILDTINDDNTISLYTNGIFTDLCAGPHVLNTSVIGEDFMLTKVSQINWKGLLLQRIEGVLFYSKERLVNHLKYIEKQESIDHRKIGEECELFKHLSISQGNVFWLENGKKLFQTICDYLEKQYIKYNYMVIKTPLFFQNELWKITGHWDKYKDNMYITQDEEVVKPMNCPGHVEVFKTFNASYKDLPVRLGEIAHVHRKEETGALNGLKRACGFHQDDGHIFCTSDQISQELDLFFQMLDEIYKDFGFEKYEISVSTKPENSIGDEAQWQQSEQMLIDWFKEKNKQISIAKGDGAFYGPKIEIKLKDNFMRKWTCGTIQWDSFLPVRLQAEYNSVDNSKLNPIMLHRAILGSIERFIAILLEHYEGHLPLWLMPVQVVVVSISEKTKDYAKDIYDQLKIIPGNPIKVNVDISDNTLNSKLKKSLKKRIPFVIIVGEKEIETKEITIRYQNKNKTMKLEDFTKKIILAIVKKTNKFYDI